jgi:hypothetical protein
MEIKMTEHEFVKQAIIKAKIDYAKTVKAGVYTELLTELITELKENGFKLIIMCNDVRVTF